MGAGNLEGQMDFFGLIEEYTDGQGARVRVRNPVNRKIQENNTSKRKPQEVKQMTLEFIDLDAEYEAELAAKAAEPPKINQDEPEERKTKERKPGNKSAVESVKETEPRPIEEPVIEPVIETVNEVAEKPATENIIITETKTETKTKTEIETEAEAEIKTEPEPVAPSEHKKAAKAKKQTSTELLFKQCTRCWCHDCKHNSRNEAVPREMCGARMPCPACDGCIAEDMATVCEIGNAEEGCKFRAIEEGIFVPDTFEE